MEQDRPRLLARWSTARDVWEIPDTEGLLCEHLAVWSETFPTSVMWDRSGVYELPTSEPVTDDSATSSLLPTPVTEPDTGNGHARNLGKEARLLPTPATSDTNGPGEHGTGGLDLRTAVSNLP